MLLTIMASHRLIASADDLEALALDDNAPIWALDGWRRDIFGTPALKLKNGKDRHCHREQENPVN